jgi:CMP-N,N'-diacetyllegionaminic acid synthase
VNQCVGGIAALITARGGSKGLPGKNIRPLGGAPLIAHSIRVAQQTPGIDAVYLSTDCPEIAAVARDHGCLVPFLRSAGLASDTAGSWEVVCDALDRLPAHGLWLLLQPTSPLRATEDLTGVITLMQQSDADSCVSVTIASEHPWMMFGVEGGGKLRPLCLEAPPGGVLRQDLPPAYVLNGAIYGFRPDWLRAAPRFIDAATLAWVMPPERSVDIDDIDDFERAERLLSAKEGLLQAQR